MTKRQSGILTGLRKRGAAVVALLALLQGTALANPMGAQVISGQASFSTSGNSLSVTNSPNTIINWNSFSINPGELTRFIQQSSTSSVLNRVTGGNASAIYGALQSNGRVFLINQNGILFGPGATVDVNGLMASTLDIRNEDFLAGRFKFFTGIKAAGIENQGRLGSPSGGSIYLIAPDIKNSGIINAPNGDVILAAGHTVSLVDSGAPDIAAVVSAPENQALNLGQIIALAGRIGIYGGIIAQKGIVSASSAVSEGGKIFFKAGNNITLDAGSTTTANGAKGGEITVQSAEGTTLVSGTVEAKGSNSVGGSVKLLGQQVGLINKGSVDVSGTTGGGSALIGGDYQGKNPEVQNAKATYVGRETTIKADAANNGNGGKVIVWSDNATRAYGSISARGGVSGGNGGFVETSGHWLDVNGVRVITAAPRGKNGIWLLDPDNLTISSTASSISPIGVNPDPISWTASGASNILNTDINSGLNGGSDVTIQTTSGGSITVSSPITWSTAKNLTLASNGAILINDVLDGGATGTITLTASNGSITQSGLGRINGALLTTSSYGGTTLTGANTVSSFHAYNIGTGAIRLTNTTPQLTITGISQNAAADIAIANTGDISVAGTVKRDTSTAGDITLTSSGLITVSNEISVSNYASNFAGTGAISLTGVGITNTSIIHGRGTVTIDAGTGTFDNSASGAVVGAYQRTGDTPPTLDIKADNVVLGTDSNKLISWGTVIIEPATSTREIQVDGVTRAAGKLGLLSSDFDTINAMYGTIRLGNSTTGPITINSPITKSYGGLLSLVSADSISQNGSGIITAGSLALKTSTGNITLAAADNSITNLAADVGGTIFTFQNAGDLHLAADNAGSMNGLSGITVRGAGGMASLNATGAVSQDAGAPISAEKLAVRALGNVDLTTASNSVTKLAAAIGDADNLDKNFKFKNSGDLIVYGSVDSLGGITTEISADPNQTNGFISLTSTGGSITQAVEAPLSGRAILAQADTNVDLSLDNTAGAIAGSATNGYFSYRSNKDIFVTTVDSVAGIQAGGYVILNGAGANSGIHQDQPISGTGLALSATGDVVLNNPANSVPWIAADLSSGSGKLDFANHGNLEISSYDGSFYAGGITTNNQPAGVTVSDGTLTLTEGINAGTGNVTLTAAALNGQNGIVVNSQISGGDITLTGTGGNSQSNGGKGVVINSTVSTGSGNISITGRGGDGLAECNADGCSAGIGGTGVEITASGVITTTPNIVSALTNSGKGNIAIEGHGGAGGAINKDDADLWGYTEIGGAGGDGGVLNGSVGTTSTIAASVSGSTVGTITITGTGGAGGEGRLGFDQSGVDGGRGIVIAGSVGSDSVVNSTGIVASNSAVGTITLNGTGGDGGKVTSAEYMDITAGYGGTGMELQNSLTTTAAIAAGGSVSGKLGDVVMTGTGGNGGEAVSERGNGNTVDGGSGGRGIHIASSSDISAAGTITLTGTGGNGGNATGASAEPNTDATGDSANGGWGGTGILAESTITATRDGSAIKLNGTGGAGGAATGGDGDPVWGDGGTATGGNGGVGVQLAADILADTGTTVTVDIQGHGGAGGSAIGGRAGDVTTGDGWGGDASGGDGGNGVELGAQIDTTAGAGAITVTGWGGNGGDATAGEGRNYDGGMASAGTGGMGIYASFATVASAAGAITLTGTGANGGNAISGDGDTAGNAYGGNGGLGLELLGETIYSTAGVVNLTGTGGTGGNATAGTGIILAGGYAKAGYGGNGISAVYDDSNNNTAITSAGILTMTGTGGAGGIAAGGAGTTGGEADGGNGGYGLYFEGFSSPAPIVGTAGINLAGTGGDGGNATGGAGSISGGDAKSGYGGDGITALYTDISSNTGTITLDGSGAKGGDAIGGNGGTSGGNATGRAGGYGLYLDYFNLSRTAGAAGVNLIGLGGNGGNAAGGTGSSTAGSVSAGLGGDGIYAYSNVTITNPDAAITLNGTGGAGGTAGETSNNSGYGVLFDCYGGPCYLSSASALVTASGGITLYGSSPTVSLANSGSGDINYTGTTTGTQTVTASNSAPYDSSAESGGGVFITEQTGNLQIGAAGISALRWIELNALAGSITTDSDPAAVVKAPLLSLYAMNGIGDAANPVRTAVGTLNAANNGASGDVVIVNNTAIHPGALLVSTLTNASSGAISLENYGATTTDSLVTTGGDITIKAHSPLTIGSGGVTSTGGNITLAAGPTGMGATGDDLTLNGPLSGVDINLSAGNSILENSTITHSGAVNRTPNLNPPFPTIDQCIAAPTQLGCSVVLPSLTACTATPTLAGCSVVLPSLAACTAAPATAGCTAVLPTLTACIATPTLAGCSAVLPTLAACTATPTLAGCTAVLPTLAACTTTPTLDGCSAVLPSLAVCTAAPATTGCSAVLPTLAACIATPTLAGCSAVLPTLAACTAAPTLAGCTAVLPSLAACTTTPTLAGCSAVLPSLAACTATPTLAGCSAVLPTLAACIANPTLDGCSAVVPTCSAGQVLIGGLCLTSISQPELIPQPVKRVLDQLADEMNSRPTTQSFVIAFTPSPTQDRQGQDDKKDTGNGSTQQSISEKRDEIKRNGQFCN